MHIREAKINRISKRPEKIERISTENVSDLFKHSKFVTLIGNAGSGKSTIVKYLFIDSVRRNFKIPIKVELRYLNDYGGTLVDFIFDEIFLFHKLGFSKEIIGRLLSTGDFIFFFDGYDEINSNKKTKTTIEIDNFVTRYADNYYVITSRPYTNIDTLPLFKNYFVVDLLPSEIPAFIKKQIPINENEMSEKMIKAISQVDVHSYRSFLSNPLLLSMFILTYQSYSEIPQNKNEFYRQVFDTLFSIHDSVSKLSFVREKQCGLNKNGFETVLKLFAFISYFEEKFLFNESYIEKQLTLIKEKKKELVFENDKLIEDLQVAIGILTKEGLDYAFPHRSLQEYFASTYIVKLGEKNKITILTKILENIKNDYFYLINNQNFLNLLAEQDYNSVISYIILPLLDHERNRLMSSSERHNQINYDIQIKIYLISTSLLNYNLREEKIHKQYSHNIDYSPKHISLRGNNQLIPLKEILSDDPNFTKVDIKNLYIYLKENIDDWIENLIINIQETENSDKEIIDGI